MQNTRQHALDGSALLRPHVWLSVIFSSNKQVEEWHVRWFARGWGLMVDPG